ncbi:MAG: TerB family tellurite resistance protein [Planctomycetes bacterium]|nr:TerB family tellurite resistance protein [Planctomycetota bacterium]
MAEITYASVEALLQNASELEGAVRCTFRCPVTQADVEAEGVLEKGRELADVCPGDQSLLGGLRSALGGLFTAALGKRKAASPVRLPEGTSSSFSESERKAGIVVAFRSVADRFVWDPSRERWVSTEGAGELLSDFDRLLRLAPIQSEGDRRIAARMLVEVARADGHVTQTEWAFLASFVPGDLSSVDTYMEAPPLTAEELDKVSLGAARETMVMLAWALAHVDHDLDQDEENQLLSYAKKLKVSRERALELREYARTFLLEEALQRAFPGGEVSQSRLDEARVLGGQLGFDEAALAAAEEDFKRRYGVD